MPIGIYRYSVPYKTPVLPKREPELSKYELKVKQREDYIKALPVFNQTLKLVSHTIIADPTKRMKVRGSKPGQGKKSAALDLLAKGERRFNKHGEISVVKNDGFNKFNELYYRDRNVHCTLPELCAAWLDKAHMQRVINRAKQNIDKCTIKYNFVTKELNGNNWTYNKHLLPMRQVYKSTAVAIADINILAATNSLLRQIMLFKGIGFTQVEQDLRENGNRPVTYLLNTTIEYDRNNTGVASNIICYKVHKVTVKKTFRNIIHNGANNIEEECKIFFSSECCKNVTFWLKSLNFETK